MASSSQQPQSEGQIVPQQPVAPQPAVAASIQQFTAIAGYVPPQVWTEQALIDFHEKQKAIILDNNRVLENQQKRQNQQGWAGIVIVSGIVAFGLYLIAIGNAYGKDLVGATVLFLSGYMAGKGEAKLTR